MCRRLRLALALHPGRSFSIFRAKACHLGKEKLGRGRRLIFGVLSHTWFARLDDAKKGRGQLGRTAVYARQSRPDD